MVFGAEEQKRKGARTRVAATPLGLGNPVGILQSLSEGVTKLKMQSCEKARFFMRNFHFQNGLQIVS
jgi:hypothetical protein